MQVQRGETAHLEAEFYDENDDLADPDVPRVSIEDAEGETVLALAIPTQVGVGLYKYDYVVPDDAPVGLWQAVWYGLVNDEQVGPIEEVFDVIASSFVYYPTSAPYSTVNDLLLGDLVISAKVDKQQYVNEAGWEIDSKLGAVYQIPLQNLEPYSAKLLHRINNHLATGRLILALDVGGEQSDLHAYGKRLVEDAVGELALIVSGATILVGPDRNPTSPNDRGPSITNHDAYSAVDAFEIFAHQPYEPGAVLIGPWWQAGP